MRLLRVGLPWVLSKGPEEAQAAYLNELGCCLDHADQPGEAEPCLCRSLALFQSMGRHDRAATPGANLAANRRSVGEMEDALSVLQAARRSALSADASAGVSSPIDLHMVATLRDLARYDEALRWAELLTHSMAQHPAMAASAHAEIAALWLHLGQTARAHRALEAAAGLQTLPYVRARLMQLAGRVQFASGQPAAPLFEEALTLARRGGRGRVGAMIELDLALTREPDEAQAMAAAVGARCSAAGLAGVALAAAIRAARFAVASGEIARASTHAAAIEAAPARVLADDLCLGERWLALAEAAHAAGRLVDAQRHAQAGRDWLQATGEHRVPDAFRAGFRERNPCNRALLAWRAQLPA